MQMKKGSQNRVEHFAGCVDVGSFYPGPVFAIRTNIPLFVVKLDF